MLASGPCQSKSDQAEIYVDQTETYQAVRASPSSGCDLEHWLEAEHELEAEDPEGVHAGALPSL